MAATRESLAEQGAAAVERGREKAQEAQHHAAHQVEEAAEQTRHKSGSLRDRLLRR
jgi:hypothetical protein